MWFGRKTLKDFFEEFKKMPNYETAETLKYEGETREKAMRKVVEEYLHLGETEIADEIQDKLINKLISITGMVTRFMKGKRSAEQLMPILNKYVSDYEETVKLFEEKQGNHIKEIRAKLREEYKVLALEETAA